MKLRIPAVFSAMVFTAVLTACSPQQQAATNAADSAAPTPAPVAQKIVIGLDDNYPPIGFRDEKGELVGSDIDLAREAAKRLNREVEFKPIDWASKEAELNSGKIDVIWNGLTVTEERKKNILFTAPYQQTGQVVALKIDSPVQKAEDLAGKVVAIQDGSTAEETLKKMPELANSFKELKRYPDMAAIYLDIKLNRLDGAILDEPLARYYTTKEPETFRILPESFSTEVEAIGVKLDNTALQQELNQALKAMYEDGTTKAVFEKWFGKDISLPIE
ncbi:MAG: amino acid ABC transporter substrate-binding protein [Neisseriaceae bacterium]|nr:amino acid ABC transporter substrate-binding protein [Neisseriaceae bacterium]